MSGKRISPRQAGQGRVPKTGGKNVKTRRKRSVNPELYEDSQSPKR